jgi:hypothetical protein
MTSHLGIDRGRVGGIGGSANNAPLECGPSDQIVGIALRMSAQDTVFDGRSAYAIQIACARVTIDPAGTGSTGPAYTREVTGTGQFMWEPK